MPPSNSNNAYLNVTPEEKGSFVQGSLANIFLQVSDIKGEPVDPEDIDVEIADKADMKVSFRGSESPTKVTKGIYVFEWAIDKNQSPGQYVATWTYVVNGQTYTEKQQIVVVAKGRNHSMYNSIKNYYREALTNKIACAQKIPVYREQASRTDEPNKVHFTFPRWNQVIGTKIYRNENTVLTKGVSINYLDGVVEFDDGVVTHYDTISASYNFRWFTDEQLDGFIQESIDAYNHTTPFSHYDITTLPLRSSYPVITKAAVDAIRELIFCLMFQEPQQVFGGAEMAQQVRGDLETLKRNYEEDVKYFFDQKKLGPYPSMVLVSIPEYTLPGGRSRWFRSMFV